jgi:signal transduction histidine kinase/DNA-binding response OmpR family regulator
MRKRSVRGLLLLVIILSAVRLLWPESGGEAAPRAEGGVMDLGGWHPAEDGSVDLTGEWLFVPGAWIDPSGDPASLPASVRTIRVPGGWDGSLEEGRSTPFGYGTYLLKVLLPPDGGDVRYGLRIANVRSAHALYANGKRIGGAGAPGMSREATEPANMPYVAAVGDAGRELTIVLHVANFHYAWRGGIFESVSFGPLADLYREHERKGAYDTVISAGFAAIGGLHLLLYAVRLRSPDTGWFAALLLLVALYWMTHGNKMLYAALPGINYFWQTRLQFFSTAGVIAAFVLFVRALYPAIMNRMVVYAVLAALAALTLYGLAAPPEWAVLFDPAIVLFGLAAAAWALACMALGTMREEDEQLYTLAGISAVLHYAVFQGLFFLGIRPQDGLPPVELVIFLGCVLLLWFHRFQRTLKRVEKLSGELVIASRLKDEFMTNASHELRTPLQSMVSLAELMLEEGRAEEKDAHRLRLMLASGRKLSHLLDEMLDLTKLIEGSAALRLRAVDVRHTAAAVLELVEHLSGDEERRPALENRVPPGLPLVRADANRLLQILLNLVHEAMQASGVREVEISAALEPNGRELSIAVARSGGGGPAEERLETAVSRKLVELHGGRLDLVTTRDDRTAARFTLPVEMPAALPDELELSVPQRVKPLSDTHAAAGRRKGPDGQAGKAPDMEQTVAAQPGVVRSAARPDAAEPADGAAAADGAVAAGGPGADEPAPDRPAVLLADDDPEVLQVTAELLDREGLAVTAVRNGAQALAELERRSDWELVVADTLLPVLSGLELCRQIRQRMSITDLPVLLMTKRSGAVDLLVGFESGANDMIAKPLDPIEFTGRVRTLIRMKRSVREQLRTEMALMQAQIRPHFLYNTLNTIAGLSETDPDRMRELLYNFGQYLRASFDASNLQRLVPFEQEWLLVTTYLQIEKARFGERIRLSTNVQEGLDFSLPPLSVQPIVENALRHGILKRIEGGSIDITVAADPDGRFVRIEVRDDGVGFEDGVAEAVLKGTHGGGIGLSNVHRRLLAQYGRGLEIGSTPGAGTKIVFSIPLQEGILR